jgi:hypothetical protein
MAGFFWDRPRTSFVGYTGPQGMRLIIDNKLLFYFIFIEDISLCLNFIGKKIVNIFHQTQQQYISY